jgi:hypothetical protein
MLVIMICMLIEHSLRAVFNRLISLGILQENLVDLPVNFQLLPDFL